MRMRPFEAEPVATGPDSAEAGAPPPAKASVPPRAAAPAPAKSARRETAGESSMIHLLFGAAWLLPMGGAERSADGCDAPGPQRSSGAVEVDGDACRIVTRRVDAGGERNAVREGLQRGVIYENAQPHRVAVKRHTARQRLRVGALIEAGPGPVERKLGLVADPAESVHGPLLAVRCGAHRQFD